MKNQGAFSLARQADPEGKRTIGVLTKADTVEAGEENGWISVLRNEKNPLRHGYFVSALCVSLQCCLS